MHQRLWKSVAKPASGPEYSVPATGWAGTKARPRQVRRDGATTAPFTEPTSETMAPGFRCGADLGGDRAAGADGHAEDDEVGARGPLAGEGRDLVGERRGRAPRSRTRRDRRRWRRCCRQAVAPRGMGDRGADQADADDRDRRSGLRQGGPALRHRPTSHESRERVDDARFASSEPTVRRSASGRP